MERWDTRDSAKDFLSFDLRLKKTPENLSKPGGPLGAYRQQEAIYWHRVSPFSFPSSSSHIQQTCTTKEFVHSHPKLVSFSTQIQLHTRPRNVICPRGA